MKTTNLLTLAALIGTCTFAAAQETPKNPDRPKREVPAEMLEKFDADKDGKLSDDERKAMRGEMKAMQEKRQAEMLKKYDKDADGKLSDDERAVAKTDREAKRAALLEKYDADKDGKLSPDEIKTARAAGEEIPPPGMGRGPGGKRGPGGPDGKGGPDAPAPAAPSAE